MLVQIQDQAYYTVWPMPPAATCILYIDPDSVMILTIFVQTRGASASDSISVAVKEVGVLGVESKADRIRVPVILESFHVKRDPVASWRCYREGKSDRPDSRQPLSRVCWLRFAGSQTWMCSGRKPRVNSAPGATSADLVLLQDSKALSGKSGPAITTLFSLVCSARTLRKFILGAPIKPATNRFAGR